MQQKINTNVVGKTPHGKSDIKITEKIKLTKKLGLFHSVCGHHHNSFAVAFALFNLCEPFVLSNYKIKIPKIREYFVQPNNQNQSKSRNFTILHNISICFSDKNGKWKIENK